MKDYQLILGDCLEKMKDIPDASIDLCLTDPPYGTTACKWDSVIPFEPMWKELKRIVKPKGAICLFGSQPFTSALIMSNPKMFKYEWIWQKSKGIGFINARNAPLKFHENIVVFSEGVTANCSQNPMPYYPQGLESINKNRPPKIDHRNGVLGNRPSRNNGYIQTDTNFPRSILMFSNDSTSVHPTQKPVELLRYLIRTYTLENETVLDFTMGSGSTGCAAMLENRRFIGIEQDEKYFSIAQKRIAEAMHKEPLLQVI